MRGAGRAFVNEQVTHGDVGVAEVSAENIFTEEVIKSAACGMAAEERAPLMPRAVKLEIARLDVLLKASKERRQELLFVLLRGVIDLAAIESLIGGIGVNHSVKPPHRQLHRTVGHGENGNAQMKGFDFFEFARLKISGA